MNVVKKLTGKGKMGPIEWDQRIKAIQAELQSIGDERSEKLTELRQAEGRLKNSEKELEFYTVPPGRHENRVYPRNRKEDQARIEQDVRRGKVAVEFAEKAYQPLQEQDDELQAELNALIENPPAVSKADLKKSYSAVTALEQQIAKITAARDNAIESSDSSFMDALNEELEQAKSAYELAASGVHLGEATQADVDAAAKHLREVRAKINEAEDAAASQRAAVSGYGRRIEVIEAELKQVNETHRIMVGLYGEAEQNAAVERINQALESIKADLGEVAQAHSLMGRFRAGNSRAHGGIGIDIKCREYTTLHGLNTGRLLPDEAEVRKGVQRLLASIGYPIAPEDNE